MRSSPMNRKGEMVMDKGEMEGNGMDEDEMEGNGMCRDEFEGNV